MRGGEKKAFFLALLLLVLVFADGNQVKASENGKVQGYSYWENQNKDVLLEEKQQGAAYIRIDAAPSSEEYGYSVLTGTFLEGLSGNGFQVTLKAESEGTAYLMFQLQDQSGNSVKLKEDALIVNEEKKQIDVLAQGQLEMKDAFFETITIPFESFESSENFDREHIINYSIGITQEKDSVFTLEASDFKWYGTKEEIFGKAALASLSGQAEVALPVHGEAIAFYTIDNPGYRFQSFQKDGISFDDTGKLTVGEQAGAKTIVLEAVNKEGMTVRKEVSLVLPLRSTVNYISTFPAPAEVDKIHTFMEGANNDTVIHVIRAAAILVSLIILSAFCYYRKKGRENK